MSNLNINWKTPNITIIEPAADEEDFDGKELEVVEKYPKIIKRMLKSMGIRDSEDQDQVIQNIRILISKGVKEDDPTDVWDKERVDDDKNKSKSPEWN